MKDHNSTASGQGPFQMGIFLIWLNGFTVSWTFFGCEVRFSGKSLLSGNLKTKESAPYCYSMTITNSPLVA